MYKIIGADGKEYGPISADEIRQWISEDRVNGQTQTCAEGSEEWKPLAEFPEFAFTAAPFPAASSESAPGGLPSQDEVLARDFTLDLGDSVSKSWRLIKADMGPVVGITFIVMIVLNAINQGLSFISRPAMNDMIQNHHVTSQGIVLVLGTSIMGMPLSTVLLGGLFRYYLKLIRGQQAGLGDAFSGFSHGFNQLALLGFVQGILVWVGILCFILPGIYLATAWYFSTILVADQGMDFWSAMEYSRKVVSKHWFAVFGFLFVMGLLAASGIVACCIGILITAPLAFMAIVYAYENIFRRRTA